MTQKATEPKNLIEQVAAMNATADAEAAVERAEGRKVYRDLLARAERPKRGDAEKLTQILPALGKTTADVEADLAVLAEARDLAAQAAQAETFAEKRRAERKRFEAADEARKQGERDRDSAYSEIARWTTKERDANTAGQRLERLRASRSDLFAGGA